MSLRRSSLTSQNFGTLYIKWDFRWGVITKWSAKLTKRILGSHFPCPLPILTALDLLIPSPLQISSWNLMVRFDSFLSHISHMQSITRSRLLVIPSSFHSYFLHHLQSIALILHYWVITPVLMTRLTDTSLFQLSVHPGQWHQINVLTLLLKIIIFPR